MEKKLLDRPTEKVKLLRAKIGSAITRGTVGVNCEMIILHTCIMASRETPELALEPLAEVVPRFIFFPALILGK